MEWIDVNTQTPQEGELVLVIGFLSQDIGGIRKKKSIGLVNWKNSELSPCSDICYYGMDYKDITHYSPIPKDGLFELLEFAG